MTILSAATLPEHQVVSIVVPGIQSQHQGHTKPLAVLKVSQSGTELTIHLYRGKSFLTEDGDAFTPLGYLSVSEYLLLRSLLPRKNESGETTERRLPYEWEKIDFIVWFMRSLRDPETINSTLVNHVPEGWDAEANLAISLVLGDAWDLSRLSNSSEVNHAQT